MSMDFDTVPCPDCAAPVRLSAHAYNLSLDRWSDEILVGPGEVMCPKCGHEFHTNRWCELSDDGPIDTGDLLEVDEDGELNADTYALSSRCPKCQRPVEVGEEGPARCPHCRHSFPVVIEDGPSAEEDPIIYEEYEPYDDDCCDFSWQCPSCGTDDGYRTDLFAPLQRNWVECTVCGVTFRDRELYEEVTDVLTHRFYGTDRRRACVVVAADGSGDETNFQKALASVYPGGTVILRPGVYAAAEPFYPYDVTIRGEGPAEAIRLSKRLSVIGGRLILSGVTLEQGLHVQHSRVSVTGCHIGPALGCGLEIEGSRSRVIVRDSRISGCERGGVRVGFGSVARLHRCRLAENRADGVRIERGGWLRLQDCDILRNEGHGVRGLPHASVFLHRCRVRSNEHDGVRLTGARSVLTRCDIGGQERHGVVIRGRSHVLLRRCALRGNRKEDYVRERGACVCQKGCGVKS